MFPYLGWSVTYPLVIIIMGLFSPLKPMVISMLTLIIQFGELLVYVKSISRREKEIKKRIRSNLFQLCTCIVYSLSIVIIVCYRRQNEDSVNNRRLHRDRNCPQFMERLR